MGLTPYQLGIICISMITNTTTKHTKTMKLNELKTGDRFIFAKPLPDEEQGEVQVVVEQCRGTAERGPYCLRDAAITNDWGLTQPIIPRQMVPGDSEVIKKFGNDRNALNRIKEPTQ